MHPRHLVFPVLLALASLSTAAQANVGNIVLSNFPGTSSYLTGAQLTASTWEAVGLTTNTSSQTFTSMGGEFFGGLSGGTIDGGIYSNVSGSPGTLLAAFTPVSVPASTAAFFSMSTTSPFTLQPSTSYWFVLHDPPSAPFNWELDSANSNTGTVPTAFLGYSFLGYKSSINTGSTWTPDSNSMTVSIVTIPEPATLTLAALGAVALLTRRRRVMPTPS